MGPTGLTGEAMGNCLSSTWRVGRTSQSLRHWKRLLPMHLGIHGPRAGETVCCLHGPASAPKFRTAHHLYSPAFMGPSSSSETPVPEPEALHLRSQGFHQAWDTAPKFPVLHLDPQDHIPESPPLLLRQKNCPNVKHPTRDPQPQATITLGPGLRKCPQPKHPPLPR